LQNAEKVLRKRRRARVWSVRYLTFFSILQGCSPLIPHVWPSKFQNTNDDCHGLLASDA